MTPEEKRLAHNEYCLKWNREHPEAKKRNDKRWRVKNAEKLRRDNNEYRKQHLKESQERIKKWKSKNKHKVNAEAMAERIIRLKENCEICGGTAKYRHHPDYSKPLVVMHVRAICHGKIHRDNGIVV